MKFAEKLLQKTGLTPFVGWVRQRRVLARAVRIPFINGNMLEETETWFTRYLAAFLAARKGLFVDVGVNLGQTLLKVKCLEPGRPYVGFEVNTACVHYATALINSNKFSEATILPVGLAEQLKLVVLNSNSSVDSSASIVEGFRNTDYKFQLPVLAIRGDDIVPVLPGPPVSIIKIDVEGSELDVVSGLGQTLGKLKPIVTCEILPVYDSGTEVGKFRLGRQEQLLAMMHELGYECFRMRHDSWLEPAQTIQIHSDLELSDYVFLHPDHGEITPPAD